MSSPKTVLILGQGIVGSLLAWRLMARGVDVQVIDAGPAGSSSYAAAGIINPLTGRRFVKTWRVQEIATEFNLYKALGQQISSAPDAYIRPLIILRDLSDTRSLNDWSLRRSQPGNQFFMAPPQAARTVGSVALHADWAKLDLDSDDELEVLHLENSPGYKVPAMLGPSFGYRVDFVRLVADVRTYLRLQGRLIEQRVSIDEIKKLANGRLSLAGYTADAVIDCTGSVALNTRRWSNLGWRGTKGEALRLELKGPSRRFATKQRHFLCPVGKSSTFWVGGTNEDVYEHNEPTELGRDRLAVALAGFGESLPETFEHVAAVRPTTRDRRPLLGQHAELTGLWLCNGTGTKGASLAPYITSLLIETIFEGAELDAEVNISRFSQA